MAGEGIAANDRTEVVPFDQASWDRWQARGRAHDRALRRRLPLIIAVIAIAVASGAFWIM
jgi:hypothetical protein